jgi:hypothetical protein
MNGRVAQRITRLTTDQKIAGSNPAAFKNLFFFSIFFFQLLHWGELIGTLRVVLIKSRQSLKGIKIEGSHNLYFYAF